MKRVFDLVCVCGGGGGGGKIVTGIDCYIRIGTSLG